MSCQVSDCENQGYCKRTKEVKKMNIWKRIKDCFTRKPHKRNMQDYRMLFVLAAIPMAGCTSTYAKYDRYAPDGKTPVSSLSVHRRTLGSKVSMPKVTFNPDGSVMMEGYTNDGGNEIVANGIEAACKGAVKGAVGK